MKTILLFFSLLMATEGFSQNVDSLLSAPFFDSGIGLLDSNGFSFSQVYTTSPSYWAIDSFPESVVFRAELTYVNPSDSTESYQIRIGNGGQLYSFRSTFGESVPPQWRPPAWAQPTYGGGTSYAPWVDEVWQMVCVDGALNNPPDSSYFIHQSGVYLKTPAQTQPFYSPMIAAYYDPNEKSYSVVNWGQQAHTEDLVNTGFTSSLLYYTKYRNLGHGVLQVDNMIYNFGHDNISFLNVPWGGMRNSSLDHFFISSPNNSYTNTPGIYGQTPVVQTSSTGGRVAWSNDTLGNSPAIGMVHPLTTNTNANVFRYGDAGDLSSPNNHRDYHVFEMIRQPALGQLGFGRCMSFRYFYVLGANVVSVRNTILEQDLVSNALDTAYTPNAIDVTSLHYLFHQTGTVITTSISEAPSGLLLRTGPYLNSFPLFRITSIDSTQVISSNPYSFSDMAYDGTTLSLELLGFLDAPSNLTVSNDTVCSGESYTFPDGTAMDNMNVGTSHVSYLQAAQAGWDSLIVTNLFVTQVDTGITQTGLTLTSDANEASYQWLDCQNSYDQIPGETGQSFTAIANGSYAVDVTQNGCADTSACTSIGSVGVLENSFGKKLVLYPNPNHGKFIIDLGDAYKYIHANLLSVNGQPISDEEFKNSRIVELEIAGASGYYFIEIKATGNKKAILRILKE